MNVAKVIRIKDGEGVVRVIRRYWLTALPQALLAAALVYAPFFFMVPLLSMGTWGLVVLGTCVTAGFLYAVRAAVIWRWNVFVITTHRIVDIDQRGLFDRMVSEAPHDRIQDVSYRVRGIFGHIFGYGTISLQTAGNAMNLEIRGIADPREVHHVITEQMRRDVPDGGGVRSAKVARLLEAASDMTDAEARAFISALQEALKGTKRLGWSGKDVEELYADTDTDADARVPR